MKWKYETLEECPTCHRPLPNAKRNRAICDAYEGGETMVAIAKRYDITPQRVRQIIRSAGKLKR
jgi:transposase-like protein